MLPFSSTRYQVHSLLLIVLHIASLLLVFTALLTALTQSATEVMFQVRLNHAYIVFGSALTLVPFTSESAAQ